MQYVMCALTMLLNVIKADDKSDTEWSGKPI